MKRLLVVFAVLLFAFTSFATAQNRTYTISDLMKVRRVADPQVSPDGTRVAFTIGDVNYEANRVVNQIYTVSIDGGHSETTHQRFKLIKCTTLVARRKTDRLCHRWSDLEDGKRRRRQRASHEDFHGRRWASLVS